MTNFPPISIEDGVPDDFIPEGFVRPSFLSLANFGDLYASQIRVVDGEVKAVERRVAVDLLRIFLACKVPITLWGPVGARKTRTIEALSRLTDENGTPYQVITMQPSTQDSSIISGIFYTAIDPKDNEVVMKRSIPDVAKQVVEYWRKHRGLTIIFADEMTTCMVSQQNAMLGVLTHGKFDSHDINPYTSFCMAANPQGTVSTVNPLGEAVMNRGGHIAWYGDVDLFLSDWKSGWNGATTPPPDKTQWYIDQIIKQDKAGAFRNPEKWDTDELIPWDMMEHSERSTTNLADIITFIDETFPSDTPDQDKVRQHYIIEATQALQGKAWANKMRRVIAIENASLSPASIIEKVRSAGITHQSDIEDVRSLTDVLHVKDGVPINQAQYADAASKLSKAITQNGEFSTENYISFCAFVISSPNQAMMMSARDAMKSAAKQAVSAVKSGNITQAVMKPSFLQDELLATLMK